MAFSVTKLELWEQAFKGNATSATFEYIMEGTDLHPAAINEWLRDPVASLPAGGVEWPDGSIFTGPGTPLPAFYGTTGYVLGLADVDIDHYDDVKNRDFVRLQAQYRAPDQGGDGTGGIQPAGSFTFAFEIGPDNEIQKQSIATLTTLNPTGGTAPNTNRGIHLGRDGLPEGVKIPDSPCQFSLEYTDSATGFFTETKINQILRMRGKKNNATFRGLAAGECRFIGAIGQIGTGGNSTIQFRYGVFENETGLSFPGLTGTYAKEGWDYFWVYYGHPEDAADANTPSGGYVEQILEAADLNTLFT